jgi:hypothetical protein
MDEAKGLYCVVYADELQWHGSSAVRFDVRRPDARYLHFAVEQVEQLSRGELLGRLLAAVRVSLPTARLIDVGERAYIEA